MDLLFSTDGFWDSISDGSELMDGVRVGENLIDFSEVRSFLSKCTEGGWLARILVCGSSVQRFSDDEMMNKKHIVHITNSLGSDLFVM